MLDNIDQAGYAQSQNQPSRREEGGNDEVTVVKDAELVVSNARWYASINRLYMA